MMLQKKDIELKLQCILERALMKNSKNGFIPESTKVS